MRPLIVPAALIALTLGACASQPMSKPGQDRGMSRAVEQPIRDLSLIREQAPPVLQHAVATPYDREHETSCASVIHELAELDDALGPDLQPRAKPGNGLSVGGLASDLVGGAIGLPFRGIVRQVTGAEERDRNLRAAVLAGMVRRGFLKGRLAEMTCEPPVVTGSLP
jgi:hypothetical protein